MDDNYKFYAKPLEKNNIYELKYNLNYLMDTLNEQIDCVRYVKNTLKNERMNQEQVFSKVFDLLNKFDELITIEIKSINSFIIDISSKKLIEVSEVLKNRYEDIRNNFNKIMTNLHKMLDSNPEVRAIKENYYSNKTASLNGSKTNRPTKSSLYIIKSEKDNTDERRNKINDYNDSVDDNSYDYSKTSYDANKLGDNSENLENQISNLYKNINSSNYKSKNASIPKKPLSKTSSNSNLAIQKEDKIKNIKTYHNEKVYFQNLQNFIEELEHIKDFCRNLQKSQQENCLIANEKKNFEKMKSDVIKISSDVNVLKDEFQEIHSIFKQITTRINNLEEENNNLKNQNKNLIKNIKQASSNYPQKNEYISIEDDYTSDDKPIKGPIFNDKSCNQNNSKFNSQNNFVGNQIENTNNNLTNNNRCKSGGINTFEEANMSGFSDLQSMQNNSSIEMNLNLKNNTQNMNQNNNSKKRFLIPK